MSKLDLTKSICSGCSLLCDDIDCSSGVAKTNGCKLGSAFYQIEPAPPKYSVDGKAADLAMAAEAAAKILAGSKAPLVCGLDQLTMQAQVVTWKIAERIGATVDTTTSNHGRASMFALQRIGKVTATIGEIASRSDVVLFWFCDPVVTHPRLLERLGKRLGKRNCKIIVVDENRTETSKAADQFVQVPQRKAASVLSALQAMAGGIKLNSNQLARVGIEAEVLNQLFEAMATAQYGSVFFGQPNADSRFDLFTDSMHSLIRKLNDVTRFVGQKLRSDSNAQSAEDVLAWSSGYPFAVNYAKRFPRFNWLEHSAESILERGECDSILLATGTDLQTALGGLSRTAKSHLESIHKITLSPIPDFRGDVSFAIGVPGLNDSGDLVRNDGLALPAKAIQQPEISAVELLETIHKKLTVAQ